MGRIKKSFLFFVSLVYKFNHEPLFGLASSGPDFLSLFNLIILKQTQRKTQVHFLSVCIVVQDRILFVHMHIYIYIFFFLIIFKTVKKFTHTCFCLHFGSINLLTFRNNLHHRKSKQKNPIFSTVQCLYR